MVGQHDIVITAAGPDRESVHVICIQISDTKSMRGGHANAAERNEMQQQQAKVLANLATETAAYRQVVAELSIRNATLTHELHAATATIATLQQRLASYT